MNSFLTNFDKIMAIISQRSISLTGGGFRLMPAPTYLKWF